MSDTKINCSVTVMPIVYDGEREELVVGFLRRPVDDESFGGMLVAPGGKVEESDGEPIDEVPYYSVEEAAVRELKEEAGIDIQREGLEYFCSLTLLSNGRMVLSFFCWLQECTSSLEWLSEEEIKQCPDFAPGMREEALLLIAKV